MKFITPFEEYLLLEASRKEMIQRFNQEYQELYNKLAHQVDVSMLNQIKGRLLSYKPVIDKFGLKEKILNVNSISELFSIFDEMKKLKNEIQPQHELTPEEKAILSFPRKFQGTIREIVNKEHPSINELKRIADITNNLILAIERQGKDKELIEAKSLEHFEDILKRVELVTVANKWADLLPRRLRIHMKNIENLEKFADIISDSIEYYGYYKDVILKKVAKVNTIDEFFELLTEEIGKLSTSNSEIIKELEPYIDNGLQIEHHDDNYLLVWIYSYEASTAVGRSRNWCISYPPDSSGESYFKSYVLNDFNKQYFVWDFTKDKTDLEYRVGVTIDRETGKPSYCHLANDNSCLSRVESFPWYKYMHNLTPQEIKIWYDFLVENGIKIDNPEVILEYAIATKDVETFKKSFNTYKNNYISNPVKFKQLLINIVDNNLMDFLKIITDSLNTGTLLPGFGTLLIKAYENGNKEMFEFLKTLVDKRTLMVLKNSSIKNEEMKKYLEYYQKTL